MYYRRIHLLKYAGKYLKLFLIIIIVCFSEIRLQRDKFLEHLKSASNELETVEEEFMQYLATLHGFVFNIQEEERIDMPTKNVNDQKSEKELQSKLRYLEEFIWTNSMLRTEAL